MTPDAYFKWLEARLTDAVHRAMDATASEVTRRVRNEIPSNRVKTRRALRYQLRRSGTRIEARIVVRFQQNYRSSNSQTERLLTAAWDRQRPETGAIFSNALSTEIRSI